MSKLITIADDPTMSSFDPRDKFVVYVPLPIKGPERNHLDSLDELSKENVLFIGAFLDEEIKGIGAVKIMGGEYGEIKRVYVSPVGRRVKNP